MKEQVLETIQKYHLIEKGDKIVLAVSGGPDSMCMLDILRELSENTSLLFSASEKNFEIVVAHVNHMIRNEAKKEEEYVRQYCLQNKIVFYGKSIDVQKIAHTNKIGIEEAGRLARYEFFQEILQKENANKIAIAHNKNDKIETILMHAFRGCGIEGLKGIEAKRGNIIRPLIECERKQIENYCEERQLHPKIDSTNFDNCYTRNKIRNILIPYVQKEFNPNIIDTINRLSSMISEEDNYLENVAKQVYEKLVIEEKEKEIVIDLKNFNTEEKVIKARVIRYIIKRLFGSNQGIEKIHIEDIIKLCSNNIGNKFLLPNKNCKVLVKNHRIYFINQN